MSNANPDFSNRDAATGVDELFLQRWSPRAFSKDVVPAQDLRAIMDAARWSPSAYNEQPWRFYTSTAESHERFLSLLVEANQRWASSAPVLGFVVASTQFERNGKDNAHAVFDTGSAWMAVNLQAARMGYHVHGMAGILYDDVYSVLELDPQQHRVICGFALGRVDIGADEPITSRKVLKDVWVTV